MLIKNKLVLDNDFVEAFSSLMSLKMPAKQCLEVSSCIDDLVAQSQILIRARRSIVDKYCLKDDSGQPINDNGRLVFEDPAIQKKCMDELNEIYEEEIDLAISKKIKISSDILMTPKQVKLLKDIIEISEVQE